MDIIHAKELSGSKLDYCNQMGQNLLDTKHEESNIALHEAGKRRIDTDQSCDRRGGFWQGGRPVLV